MLSSTPVIVAPAGMLPAILNAIRPRRLDGVLFVPEKMPAAPPPLLFGTFSNMVLSLLAPITSVKSARTANGISKKASAILKDVHRKAFIAVSRRRFDFYV